MYRAMVEAMRKVNTLLSARDLEHDYRINSILTTGKEMMVTRYISTDKRKAHSLYFSLMHEGVVIASEQLTDGEDIWKEVPYNHALLIDPELNITTTPLDP